MLKLAKDYDKSLEEEEKMTAEQLEIKNVGKVDPKRHLEEKVDVLMTNNVVQCLGDAAMKPMGTNISEESSAGDSVRAWGHKSMRA